MIVELFYGGMEEASVQPAENPEIPDKLYFRIGEVAKLAGIKPYVLRFWETEFNGLGPKKSGTGHRLYRRKDVEMVLEIKRLLYDRRYTIEGARKVLESKPKRQSPPPAKQNKQAELFSTGLSFHKELRKELKEILALIDKPES
jgi:DNA-binding transcriptional MerR regulator